MAQVTQRRYGEFLRKLFEVLMKQPDGLQARDAIQAVESQVTLTEYERGEYESGGRRFDKMLRFATLDTVKAGWLLKSKGRWSVTEEGRAAYQTYRDPEAFARRALQLYNEWRRSQPAAEAEDVGDGTNDASAKAITVTYEQAEEQAWSEIERHLASMPPYEFQELVAALLRAMGYHVGWVAPPGRDGGIDVLAFNDPLGTRLPRIKVQVKRQQSKVAVDGLRAFMAVLGAEDVGIFVNAGGFTRDAEDEARLQQTRRVTLLDLERLIDLWTEHYAKLDDVSRRLLPLQPIYFLAPET
jgi:restriction system protein